MIWVCSKSKVTQKIFNLQEWGQNAKLQIFIPANLYCLWKIYRRDLKLKTCQMWSVFVCDHFIKVFYNETTCIRLPLLSGPRSGRFIQVWLYSEIWSFVIVHIYHFYMSLIHLFKKNETLENWHNLFLINWSRLLNWKGSGT